MMPSRISDMALIILWVTNTVFGIVRTMVAGACLARMWAWFMVPVFGLPALDFKHAIGLMITVNFIAPGADIAKKADTVDVDDLGNALAIAFGQNVVRIVIFPLIMLFAFFWHLYIG